MLDLDPIKRFFAGFDDADNGFACEASDAFYVEGYQACKDFNHDLVEKYEALAHSVR